MSVAWGAVRGRPKRGGPFSLWTAIAGAVGGAIVVGAIWGITTVAGAKSSATVATINGQPITQSALTNALASHYGMSLLQQMVEDRLIAVAANAKHLKASASAIASAEAAIESSYGITSSAALTSFLQQNGLTQAQFQTILKYQVLEQELSVSGINVTSAEISAYYKAHKSTFTTTKNKKKTVEPLSQVKSQIITDIKQSKAPSASVLLAKLAKQYHLTIPDPKYKSLVSAIEK